MSEGMFYTLGLNTSGFTNPLASARGLVGDFQNSIGGLLGKVAMIAAPVLGAGGAFLGFKRAIKEAADFESTRSAFKTLVGSAEKADSTIQKLVSLGASTPFEFPELADAGRKLIAFGEDAGTVDSTLRRIGDVASGVQAPIGEIAEIYGKARVQGTLFAEDINQLLGRGIPVVQQFANILGVSQSQVKELASEGQITFPMLEEAFVRLTSKGGQFAGMMEEQSHTMNGMWSTLQDNIGSLFRTLGQPINDFLRPMLQDSIDFTNRLGQGMTAFINLTRSAREQGKLGEWVGASLTVGFLEGINAFSSGVRSVISYVGTALPIVFRTSFQAVKVSSLLEPIASFFDAIANKITATLLKGIAMLPGHEEYADAARSYDRAASSALALAKAQLEHVDFTPAVQVLGDGIKKAHEEGAKAAAEATAKPLLDTTAARKRLADLGSGLNPEAWKNLMEAVTGSPLANATQQAADAMASASKEFAVAVKPAAKAAKERSDRDKDDQAGGRKPRGLMDPAASFLNRMRRQGLTSPTQIRDFLEGHAMDRSKLADFFRRKNGGSVLNGGYQNKASWLTDFLKSDYNLGDESLNEQAPRRTLNPNARAIGRRAADAINARGNQALTGARPGPGQKDNTGKATIATLDETNRILQSIERRMSAVEAA